MKYPAEFNKTITFRDLDLKNLNGFAIGKNLYDWILDNIPIGSTILELGSGAGSYELSKHYNMYSVEQNIEWVDKFPGINYIHAPIDPNTQWYDKSCLSQLPKDYQCLILDGPGGYPRNGFYQHLDVFNTNIPTVVDDTHRIPEATFAFQLAEKLDKKIRFIGEFDKSSVVLV
tara:strand:+ start:261 stop:779 length:519 start_codon:yes stop_codon:yes gene_type:complete